MWFFTLFYHFQNRYFDNTFFSSYSGIGTSKCVNFKRSSNGVFLYTLINVTVRLIVKRIYARDSHSMSIYGFLHTLKDGRITFILVYFRHDVRQGHDYTFIKLIHYINYVVKYDQFTVRGTCNISPFVTSQNKTICLQVTYIVRLSFS